MAYQVLARKWRPQDFSSLVGQEPITQALGNALVEGRIAQAYVFSGIRGVGKTTAARVFAKALNCERSPGSDERPGADPCNACEPCTEITSGADLDVLEIDAATYSKVEQVRELTESLRYGAARDRYRVVIMDEVHRLSRNAFDALLKIVEEPPPRLVFIFATTELDAVPATILSRCQEFRFRRVPSPALASHLRMIAAAEEIEVSDTALRLIARAGEGSVRDSVALLDQLATFGSGTISDHDANRLLGGLDADVFRRLLAGILVGEHGAVTTVVAEIEENGWDPQHVYSQFLTYVRDALHLALGGKPESIDLPLEEARALAEVVGGGGHESLLQLAQLLLTSELTVRRSEFGLLALEITWLRAAELPKITRVEDLLSGRVQAADLPAGVPAAAPVRQVTATPGPGTAPSPKAARAPQATVQPEGAWFQELKGRLPNSLSSLMVRGETDGDKVVLYGDDMLEKSLRRKTNSGRIDQAVAELLGDGKVWELRPVSAAPEDSPDTSPTPPRPEEPAPAAAPPALSSADRERVENHPVLQAVRSHFDITIRKIDPKVQET